MTVCIPRIPHAAHVRALPMHRSQARSLHRGSESDTSYTAPNAGSIRRSGTDYLVHGRKWWISGACDRRCKVVIFMGKTDPAAPKHKQQSMVLVPMNAPGVEIIRPMTVFGEDDAPHGHAEMEFNNVRCASVISGHPTAPTLAALVIRYGPHPVLPPLFPPV